MSLKPEAFRATTETETDYTFQKHAESGNVYGDSTADSDSESDSDGFGPTGDSGRRPVSAHIFARLGFAVQPIPLDHSGQPFQFSRRFYQRVESRAVHAVESAVRPRVSVSLIAGQFPTVHNGVSR